MPDLHGAILLDEVSDATLGLISVAPRLPRRDGSSGVVCNSEISIEKRFGLV